MVDVTNTWELDGGLVLRLLGAAVLGAVIGTEREMADQPAGLRTHIAVAVGAALFGAVSTLGFQEFDRPRAQTVLQADVTRVASNVAVGIGFLGAGVIFRQGNNIKNLTTAASLWVVAAIGLAAGVGDLGMAALATLVLLVSLVLLRPLRTLIRKKRGDSSERYLRVVLHEPHVGEVVEALGASGEVELQRLEVDTAVDETVVVAQLKCTTEAARRMLAEVSTLASVASVSEEEAGS
jgi:putative Mg2+ transporter-C (MgtC) family protein